MDVSGNRGFYAHEPGTLSQWGVVDVGLKCTHSCKFCYYSYLDGSDDQFTGMRRASFHSREHLLALVDSLADHHFLGFDVTGGEPGLHPNIVEMIAHATKRGVASRIITLGQFLARPMKGCVAPTLLEGLLDAGLTNFLFSYHAADPVLFTKITGGHLGPLLTAMMALDEQGFQYTTNTTVFEDNYRHLPALAKSLTEHSGVYLHNFILMNAYYQWAKPGRAAPVQARYRDVKPYLDEAVAILDAAGIAVNIRYAPMCAVRGLERHLVGIVGVRHDPYEWMNAINHYGGDPVAMGQPAQDDAMAPPDGAMLIGLNGVAGATPIVAGRASANGQNLSKVFAAPCTSCAALSVCDGIDANYLAAHGPDEFIPYTGEPRGDLLDRDRIAYRAAFLVKLKPWADMKTALKDYADVAVA